MDVLEKVRQWLMTYPQWDAGNLLYIDYSDAVPGNLGLYPLGLEVTSRREDLLGRVSLRCRYRFCLYRVGAADPEGADARWLMAFQQWVLEQSQAGLAPKFGDEPGKEHIRAERARLKEKHPGTGVYAVELTVEFDKYFED